MLNVVMLSFTMLNVVMLSFTMLNVVVLSFTMLHVVIFSVVMLNFILRALILNVVILSVVMLNVVALPSWRGRFFFAVTRRRRVQFLSDRFWTRRPTLSWVDNCDFAETCILSAASGLIWKSKTLHQTTFEPFIKTMLRNCLLGWKCNKICFRKKAENVYTFLATIFCKNSSGLLKSSPNGEILPNLVTPAEMPTALTVLTRRYLMNMLTLRLYV